MRINPWLFVAVLVVAALFGAGGIIASMVINRYTSTDAFCSSSCHTMTLQADNPYFQRSRHRSNNEGVRPSCGHCHIPTTNWFIETYTHLTSGIRDVFVEATHDFSNPIAWEAHRVDLEQQTLATMRAQDSVTCRSCHDANAIRPASDDGQKAHALLRQGGVTCVDCHVNLVHPPAVPVGGQPKTPSNRPR